jgi:hypothetical protein
MQARERILIALDTSDAEHAVQWVKLLSTYVGGFKVGLELVHAAGFGIFDRLHKAGASRLFYDAKLHDIPNTVARTVRAIARMGVWMVNVHASGGRAMMEAAVEAARSASEPPLADCGYRADQPLLAGVARAGGHAPGSRQSGGTSGVTGKGIGYGRGGGVGAGGKGATQTAGRGVFDCHPRYPTGWGQCRRPAAHHNAIPGGSGGGGLSGRRAFGDGRRRPCAKSTTGSTRDRSV